MVGRGNCESPQNHLHDPAEQVKDWETAWRYLKEGNHRYINSQTISRKISPKVRSRLNEGQKPFAVVLTCADSRVSPEIFFDQRQGDIFVIRNAGHIVDDTVLGSIEYAIKTLGIPLVVVVGHSCCGAVIGAVSPDVYTGYMGQMIETIRAAIENKRDFDSAVHANIRSAVQRIQACETLRQTGVTVMGAYFDIASGKVSWASPSVS